MLRLPDKLTPDAFLAKHWQKKSLFMPRALQRLRPSITRNELAWLATLDDVESRIVFVERRNSTWRYRVETGPFDTDYLVNLPKRDWTLLVHDVEKHLPGMRALLNTVHFIPDWRIDDLMVSFAAPGGGVGPHKDNYDVFLCQGIGVRDWQISSERMEHNPEASGELDLLHEFAGESIQAREGDVLYLPPGVPHWGVAKRACITYSVGMRAPQESDIASALGRAIPDNGSFYEDPDLDLDESKRGYISKKAARRACRLVKLDNCHQADVATALGEFATQPKDWLKPDAIGSEDIDALLDFFANGGRLDVHGMSKIAFDDQSLYVNGACIAAPNEYKAMLIALCEHRSIKQGNWGEAENQGLLRWMLEQRAFEIPENR